MGFGPRIVHVAAVDLAAEGGEEGHEEGLDGVRIPHPDGLPRRAPSAQLLLLLLQGVGVVAGIMATWKHEGRSYMKTRSGGAGGHLATKGRRLRRMLLGEAGAEEEEAR